MKWTFTDKVIKITLESGKLFMAIKEDYQIQGRKRRLKQQK